MLPQSVLLQWGHGCAAVVAHLLGLHGAKERASMGPRLRSRGGETPATISPCVYCASMGPRLRAVVAIHFNDEAAGSMLQWGHGCAAVVARSPLRSNAALSRLQWGHGCASRGGHPAKRYLTQRERFNGATAASRGGPRCRRPKTHPLALQWGHGCAAVVANAGKSNHQPK